MSHPASTPLPPALTEPQPTQAYLSISRGSFTSPALQNSKGNVEPNKGTKKASAAKVFHYVKYRQKNLGLWWQQRQQQTNSTAAHLKHFSTMTGWFFTSLSPLKGVLTFWEWHVCPLLKFTLLTYTSPILPPLFQHPVLSLCEVHVSSEWKQAWPAVGQGKFGTGRESYPVSQKVSSSPEPHDFQPHRPHSRWWSPIEQQCLPNWLSIAFSLLFLSSSCSFCCSYHDMV